MGKKKKILATFVTIITILLFSTMKAEAASGTISISRNKSQVVVGNTVTFTVTVNYSGGMSALQYNTSYDSSMLSMISGSPADAVGLNNVKSKTYTYTFKAKKSGTATFKFSASAATWNGNSTVNFTTKSASVSIITQQQLEASYSKNNNLSSLGVEGATLSPSFSTSVTSYTVNLPANTEKIKVTGKKADSRATISGLGEIEVEDGKNTIKVVVTAQNGSSKTYTITAIVEELDPIEVSIGEEKLTAVRKEKLLSSPDSSFEKSTAKIKDEEIPALENKNANIVLIGLKDEEGNITLYVYDEQNNTYKKYVQQSFKELVLYIEDKEFENNNGSKEITINDNKIKAYTLENDKYYYFYAKNLESGKENLYRYDEEEKTVQRCIANENEIKVEKDTDKELKLYQYIILGLFGFIVLTYLIILISSIRRHRKNKKAKASNVVVVPDEEVEETSLEEQEENDQIDNEEVEETETEEPKEIEETDEQVQVEEPTIEENEVMEKTEEQEQHKMTEEEKNKFIKDTEEEINRINNGKSESDEMVDSINELFAPTEEEKKKKKKTEKKNKKKEQKEKKKKKDDEEKTI